MKQVKGARTAGERKVIAQDIVKCIRAANIQYGTLGERIKRNEEFYRNQPPAKRSQVYPDSADMHLSLMKQKIDALCSNVCLTIAGNIPQVTLTLNGEHSDRCGPVEKDIDMLLNVANRDYHNRLAATLAAICGKSILRITFDVHAKGFHALSNEVEGIIFDRPIDYAGILIDVIHLSDFSIFPANVAFIHDAKWLGHRLTPRLQTVRELQAAKRYFDDEEIHAGNQLSKFAGRDESFNRTELRGSYAMETDEPIELFTGLYRADLDGDGVEEWYDVTVATSTETLLNIEPYTLSRPWYFDTFFHREYGSFLPSCSVAYDLQGLQLAYNELWNLMMDGAWLAAFPPLAADNNVTQNAFQSYKPGEIIQTEGGMPPTVLANRFDPSVIPALLNMIRETATEVARISENANGNQFKAGTTATEVAQIAQGEQAGINEYISSFGMAQTQICSFVRELYYHNFDTLKEYWGDALQVQDKQDLTLPYNFGLNGKTSQSTGSYRLGQLLQYIVPLLQDPEFGFDKWETGKMITQLVGLPNAQKLQHPKDAVLNAMHEAGQPDNPAGPPGMGSPAANQIPPNMGGMPMPSPSGPAG